MSLTISPNSLNLTQSYKGPELKSSGGNFKELLTATPPGIEDTRTGPGFLPKELHADLISIKNEILSGKKIPLDKLLLYQIKAGEFGLSVELLSKLAESGMATVRKLQNTQG